MRLISLGSWYLDNRLLEFRQQIGGISSEIPVSQTLLFFYQSLYQKQRPLSANFLFSLDLKYCDVFVMSIQALKSSTFQDVNNQNCNNCAIFNRELVKWSQNRTYLIIFFLSSSCCILDQLMTGNWQPKAMH